MSKTLFLLSLCALISAAQAQQRRATLRGGGGDTGKCTIEVRVDTAADVEIRGDRAFLRTLSGQPAEWRRFECSGPMPLNPVDFRFRGIDGRGSQQLVRDPRNSGGTAVVRIEDPSGGSEGYTFDVEWSGGSGFGGNNPVWNGGGGQYGRSGQYGQGGQYGGYGADAAAADCQAAVRERVSRQYGSDNVQFRNMDSAGDRGRRESFTGTFDLRRGNTWQPFGFSCTINASNGRVRSVDVRPLDQGGYSRDSSPFGSNRSDRYVDARAECEQALKQRMRGDGYRDIDVRDLRADDGRGRNDRIQGRARARRGNEDRDFDFSCAVNPNNGEVRSVQVNPR